MFKSGDNARVFCKDSSLHLIECIISDVDEENKLYKIVIDGIVYYADENHLIYSVCIYANDKWIIG